MSVYVTDTHPLVWYAADQHRKLSRKARRAFERAWDNQAFIYIPAAALWEISLLIKVGQIILPEPFERWAAAVTARGGFGIADLDVETIAESMRVVLNADPFDEAIVATARVRDLPLITRDAAITESGLVDVVW